MAKAEALQQMLNDQCMLVNKQLECALASINGDNEEARFFIESAMKQNKAFTDFMVKKNGK